MIRFNSDSCRRRLALDRASDLALREEQEYERECERERKAMEEQQEKESEE